MKKDYKTLIGLKYNRLTIINIYRDDSYRLICECLCDCGSVCKVVYYNLKHAHTKSCGCLSMEFNSKLSKSKIIDLTGKRFGNLVVISMIHDSSCSSGPLWLCLCDCGNSVECRSKSLRSGYRISCGCKSEENKLNIKRNFGIKDCTNYSRLNSNLCKNNTSGVKGVSYDKKRDKWIVFINFKRKRYFIGRFDLLNDAINARKIAEENLWGNTHEDFINYLCNLKNNKS